MHDHHHHHHEKWHGPGLFRKREPRVPRDFAARAFTVGIGGPVGSGKTALVLSICKKLIAAMGGELGVETELEKGTRFHFELDLPQGSRL